MPYQAYKVFYVKTFC